MTQTNAPETARFRPAEFRNPHGLKNKIGRVAWRVVWLLLFRPTPPRLCAGWRRMLLRMFGARLGNTYVHPSARIWAPWLLQAGSDVFVDEFVYLYNPYGISIADRTIVSQGAFLCSATHDYEHPTFELTGGHIHVGSDCWIAAGAFIAPGVTIADGAVIGARAVVVKDVEPWTVAAGNPARAVKKRAVRSI